MPEVNPVDESLNKLQGYINNISLVATSRGPLGLTQSDRDSIAQSFAIVRGELARLRAVETDSKSS